MKLKYKALQLTAALANSVAALATRILGSAYVLAEQCKALELGGKLEDAKLAVIEHDEAREVAANHFHNQITAICHERDRALQHYDDAYAALRLDLEAAVCEHRNFQETWFLR